MTIKDIAKESGYAVGTVSRVLNKQPGVSEKARKRILEVVERHQFSLNNNAKYLKQQYNNGVAIIVKGIKNMLFSGLVETLQRLIKDKGYDCFIYYIREEDHEVEHALQICRDRQPIGLFFLGSNKENFREKFEFIDIPCVMVTNSAEGLPFDNLSSVCIDDTKAAKTAVEYLIQLGHKKIGILGGEMRHSNPAKARYEGCLEAFRENGITFNPKTQYAYSYFSIESGYQSMVELLNKESDITAVFAMSDVTAIGAIRAIKDFGLRVPEDISVFGFDGIEMGQYMVPKLTTIRQPGVIMAERCVKILLDCIRDNDTCVNETPSFVFIEGESTQAIK